MRKGIAPPGLDCIPQCYANAFRLTSFAPYLDHAPGTGLVEIYRAWTNSDSDLLCLICACFMFLCQHGFVSFGKLMGHNCKKSVCRAVSVYDTCTDVHSCEASLKLTGIHVWLIGGCVRVIFSLGDCLQL